MAATAKFLGAEAGFEACDRALKPGGKMSLQTIAFPDVAYEPQRRGANWIQLSTCSANVAGGEPSRE